MYRFVEMPLIALNLIQIANRNEIMQNSDNNKFI